jgi:hypothetical protein
MRTATLEEYVAFREKLKPLCQGWVENIHNGRPIAKLNLETSIHLDRGFKDIWISSLLVYFSALMIDLTISSKIFALKIDQMFSCMRRSIFRNDSKLKIIIMILKDLIYY